MSVIIHNWGGKIIKDATATPEDVRQGKVFYNNNGKQTGLYEPMFEGYSRFFPKIENMEEISCGYSIATGSKINADTNEFTTGSSVSSGGTFKYYLKLQLDYEFIVGISVDGVLYNTFVPIHKLFPVYSDKFNIFAYKKGSYSPFIFMLDKNNIYLMNKTIDFTLHYGRWNI